jgi:hypothetical protein
MSCSSLDWIRKGELLWTRWYSTVEQGRQLLVYDADLDINSNLYLICGVLERAKFAARSDDIPMHSDR